MTYSRSLTFSTAYNFRDLGGYSGLDGRTVAWRRLFRTDSLHRLDDAGWAAFRDLGVRTVVDLRRAFEVEKHGRVRPADGLTYLNAVVEHVDWDEVPYSADEVRARWLADRYLNFTADGGDGIATALSVIADPDAAPVVVHCMAGKDRTGVVCALALALLGVADEDIAADYALTEAPMTSLMAYLRDNNPAAVEGVEHRFECPPAAMRLFLDDLRSEHGSVESYVRRIGLTGEQVQTMRATMLTGPTD
ncbi:tyrosine-protein phosphatase [Mangrovihabitans endophyticus]|uniref:Tyrosine specific protein phosphatases domain-containing protein n=1 Tax=Mangrovihabitans endophyticus TaxID=1751298 RepID=A0A8J3C559_9ACTN|nr:tyrosine-protein phosphatase [Mangrovihabitans endophyticus]GGL11063.1 hypothetical protein GCM10012284_52230 [Mangrovihabitans endophyticus]